MKKVIISILSLAMTVSMAVPAFADTTADVQGKYKAGAESPVTISADITWEDMTFDYTEGEKTWNTETHQVDQADGKWTSDTKAITVTNHSNVGIMAKLHPHHCLPQSEIQIHLRHIGMQYFVHSLMLPKLCLLSESPNHQPDVHKCH